MVKPTARLQTVDVWADGEGLVSHAGAALLVELADRVGLTEGCQTRFGPCASAARRTIRGGSHRRGGDARRWR